MVLLSLVFKEARNDLRYDLNSTYNPPCKAVSGVYKGGVRVTAQDLECEIMTSFARWLGAEVLLPNW
jgi:hypothetical protein